MKPTALIYSISLLLSVTACNQTVYRGYDEIDADSSPFSREIGVELTDEFYHNPPECVTVLPSEGGTDMADIIEDSAARNLRTKIIRVIGPQERSSKIRTLALDLSDETGRRHYVQATGCRHFATPKVLNVDGTYALVWSQKKLNLALDLSEGNDGKVLWRARHEVSRGDGGVPLSILSFGVAVVQAGMSESDGDTIPSMIDDAFRRITATLPDTRQF